MDKLGARQREDCIKYEIVAIWGFVYWSNAKGMERWVIVGCIKHRHTAVFTLLYANGKLGGDLLNMSE